MIGLDTTAIIDLFKKNSKIKEVLEKVNEDLSSSIINYQEIVFGLDLNNQSHTIEKEYYNKFFDSIPLFLLEKKSADKSSEIFKNLESKGEMIGKLDSMIAGIFMSNGVNKIITRNTKHFNKIKGLEIISY